MTYCMLWSLVPWFVGAQHAHDSVLPKCSSVIRDALSRNPQAKAPSRSIQTYSRMRIHGQTCNACASRSQTQNANIGITIGMENLFHRMYRITLVNAICPSLTRPKLLLFALGARHGLTLMQYARCRSRLYWPFFRYCRWPLSSGQTQQTQQTARTLINMYIYSGFEATPEDRNVSGMMAI